MCVSRREINDKIHLQNIFPEEVWLVILEKTRNPEDLESFSNSSLFLRNLLLPRRTQFLFKNVWRILGRRCEENISTPESFLCDDNDPSDNIIKLVRGIRMVCTSWSDAVCDFYENHSLHWRHQRDNSYTPVEWRINFMISNVFLEERPGIVDLFLSHFCQDDEKGERNPCFGRNVFITFRAGDDESSREFLKKMYRILAKYGHYIWYCGINIADIYPSYSTVTYYSQIRKMLELTPNLKVFRLRLQPHWSCCNEKLLPETLKELETEISERPLATLPDLQMLCTWRVPTPIFQNLIRHNAHINTLDIYELKNTQDYDIFTVPLSNLKSLSTSFHSRQDFEKLMGPQLKCQLTKLYVDFMLREFMDWQRIFTVLEKKWADSLTHLEINLPEAKELEDKKRIYKEGAALQLNLPHLKVLKITMRNLICMDFLLKLKDCLRDLQINIAVFDDEKDGIWDADTLEREKVIKLLSCSSRPLESNIWILFPALERFDFDLYERIWSGPPTGYRIEKDKWSVSRGEWERHNL